MANLTLTIADVRPLEGAVIRRAIASATLAFGDAVYVSGYSGDLPVVTKCAGGALATANPFGVVVSCDNPGATYPAAGDNVDVVVWGPVAGFYGMTSGKTAWVSNNAGLIADSVGTHSGVVGLSESPTVLFVRPGLFIISS